MSFDDFLPAPLVTALLDQAEPVPAVPGLRVAAGLRDAFPAIETDDALAVVAAVARQTRPALREVLAQRGRDRAFVDAVTAQMRPANAERSITDPDYATVLGARDARGRIVVGPQDTPTEVAPVNIPEYLQGEQVTLFGPPDEARMGFRDMLRRPSRCCAGPGVPLRLAP